MSEFPFQFILLLFFRLTIRRKRKPSTTQPFYLYIIHEHSMMHMIHELRTFVDRVKCLTQIHYCCSAACSYLSSPSTAFILIPVLTMNPLVTIGTVTLFLSVFTRTFTFTFLCPLSIFLELSQTSAFFGYCFL